VVIFSLSCWIFVCKKENNDLKEILFYRTKENIILKELVSEQEKLINFYESIYSSKNLATSVGN